MPSCEFWTDFFDLDDDAERHAESLRHAALAARQMRPDWPLQLTPYVLSAAQVDTQGKKLGQLNNAILSLPEVLFDGDMAAFADTLGFDGEACAKMLEAAGSGGILPSRWDMMVRAGHWQAMEVNFGGALGGLNGDSLHRIYDQIQKAGAEPLDGWFSTGAAIAAALREGTTGPLPPIYVVDDSAALAQSPLTANSVAAVLAAHLQCEVPVIGHRDLWHEVERVRTGLLTYELFTLRDTLRDPVYYDYFELCQSGRVLRGVDLRCDLFMSKAIFALLHRAVERQLFDAELCSVIRSVIPPTYLLNPSSLAHAQSRNRAEWVLKQANGYGGTGVFCGWEWSENEWQDLISEAEKPEGKLGQCVLQHRVHGEDWESTTLMPDGTWIEHGGPQVLGAFVINGGFCGANTRQAVDGGAVVNTTRQASVGVLRTRKI